MYSEQENSLKNMWGISFLRFVFSVNGWGTDIIEAKICLSVEDFSLSGIEPVHDSDEFIDKVGFLKRKGFEMMFETN